MINSVNFSSNPISRGRASANLINSNVHKEIKFGSSVGLGDSFSGPNSALDFQEACAAANVTLRQVITDNLVQANELGEGQEYTAFAIKTPGLEQFILRAPIGITADTLSNRFKVKFEDITYEPNSSITPWKQRDNMGVPLGHMINGAVEVQRRVLGKSAGSYYQDLDNSIYYIKNLMRSSDNEAEFIIKLNESRQSGEHDEDFKAYDAFQKAYANFIGVLAHMPQEAYDEAANIMVEGYQHGRAVDINHANNTLIIPAESGKKSRFGFVDTRILDENPFYQPMTMSNFMYALTTNIDPQDMYAFKTRRFLIQDSKLKETYEKDWKTVIDKCTKAGESTDLTNVAKQAYAQLNTRNKESSNVPSNLESTGGLGARLKEIVHKLKRIIGF